MQKLRVGLIGAGGMADAHVPGLTSLTALVVIKRLTAALCRMNTLQIAPVVDVLVVEQHVWLGQERDEAISNTELLSAFSGVLAAT